MYLARTFAAIPIRATDRIRPMIRMPGWSRAAPATARTLSRLMLTSATATAHAAEAKLLAGVNQECSSPAISGEPLLSPTLIGWSSRYIFHDTHNSNRPPANTRPTICNNCVTRSEEHTSELQSLMRISYAVFCLKKKNNSEHAHNPTHHARDLV